MTDRIANRPPRRDSLGRTVLTVAAAATTSAAVIWSALFYNATNRQPSAVATTPAPAATSTPASGTVEAARAPAPVTTRTS